MSILIHTETSAVRRAAKPRSIWWRLARMAALRKERQQLLSLDDHLLRDIGVTRHEAVEEGEKSTWDAPHHWHN